MSLTRTAARFGRDRRGVTVVEFAMIAPALCLTLLALTDLGYRAYVESVLQGALHEAARMATVGDKTGEQIDNHVGDRLQAFSKNATVTIDKKNYAEFSNVKKAEEWITDAPPKGEANPNDCWWDVVNIGTWDKDIGKSGLGGADDVVQYQVTISFPRLVPLGGMLGWGDTETISASTVLRNQPFAARSAASAPVRTCK